MLRQLMIQLDEYRMAESGCLRYGYNKLLFPNMDLRFMIPGWISYCITINVKVDIIFLLPNWMVRPSLGMDK